MTSLRAHLMVADERSAAGDDPPRELAAAGLPDHIDRLFRAAYGLCGSPHDAEDLVQETLARVLARPRLVRRQDDPRYLLRALRNTWIDFERARSARPATTETAEQVDWVVDATADPGTVALDVQVAYSAMHDLSPKLREAIAAVDVLGLSYREAASALRIRQGTLMSRLSRARERVSAAIEGAAPA
jgi:RNA polymerase sigma-70 factor (ECF subfamily)